MGMFDNPKYWLDLVKEVLASKGEGYAKINGYYLTIGHKLYGDEKRCTLAESEAKAVKEYIDGLATTPSEPEVAPSATTPSTPETLVYDDKGDIVGDDDVIINMTPHDINITGGKTIPPSGQTVRLSVTTTPAGEIAGVKLTKTVFGNPEGLPDYQNGVFYVVSQLVKSALPDREDLLVPAEMVRDGNGRIVGCKSLGI